MSKGDFEKSAQQTAVDAVERRWQQKHDADEKQRSRRRFGNWLTISVLLSVLAGIGCFVAQYFVGTISLPLDFDIVGFTLGLKDKPSNVEIDRRNRYVRMLESFRGRECVQWRDAPASVNPKTAVAGVRYLVLCGDKNDQRLYELLSDGRGSMSAMALSPIFEPMELDMDNFRAEVRGRPYLILCNDTIYVVGCKDEDAVQRLMTTLF